METLMTLEDFHQLVLFKLLDKKVPDYGKWVAVDANGGVCVYNTEPNMGCRNHYSTNNFWDLLAFVEKPIDIRWEDCLWKL